MMSVRGAIFTSAFAISSALAAGPAMAQADQGRNYQLEAQDLGAALRSVGRVSNSEIFFETSLVEGKRAPALNGRHTPREAVDALLQGTNLVALERRGAIIIRERFPASQTAVSDRVEQSEIVVTGSRIRGGPATSPVTTVSRDEAEKLGQTDLGQIIRDLPQNFSGGQNPTNAAGGQGGVTNISGSSTLNLRGLGSDASLTLVNGHRVPFDAVSQGIDISAIPLAAIEKIDIVTDGASALYGSDAIAGVANVILRRSVDGVITSARLGAATDGGAVTQQYSIAAGPSWKHGGFMIAADYQRATEILARQRSYTAKMTPNGTLIPDQEQFSLVFAAKQNLTDAIRFDVDGHYMDRSTSRCLAVGVSTNCFRQGNEISSTVNSWSISPSIRLALSSGWELRLSGTYGESDTAIATQVYSGGLPTTLTRPVYINDLKSIEFGAEGTLFSLPGGAARLALGAGYRSSTLNVDSRRYAGGVETVLLNVTEDRDVGFAYGEFFLPLVSASNNVDFVQKLHFVAALRYEDHHNVERVTTPKLGLIYSPLEGFEFKTSWGKSFKAPTLYQTAQPTNGQLINSTLFTPRPTGSAPVLYLFGGNPHLSPERATTWTASLTASPSSIDGLRAEIGYFHIRYRDRVASPILGVTGAFQVINSAFVQLNPSASDVLSAVEGINGAFTNLTGGPFEPSTISAIVRNPLQNVSLQSLQGVDLSLSYLQDLGANGRITVKASTSYLDSKRRVTKAMQPAEQAGVIFTPPHWRGRMSASWSSGNVSLSAALNYVGKTADDRQQPVVGIDSFTTLDAVANIRTSADRGLLANIEWTVGVLNALNERPSPIRATDPAALPYDSTNHSTYGRIVNLTLKKTW